MWSIPCYKVWGEERSRINSKFWILNVKVREESCKHTHLPFTLSNFKLDNGKFINLWTWLGSRHIHSKHAEKIWLRITDSWTCGFIWNKTRKFEQGEFKHGLIAMEQKCNDILCKLIKIKLYFPSQPIVFFLYYRLPFLIQRLNNLLTFY